MSDRVQAHVPPARVLVVDDNQGNLLAIADVLQPLGHALVTARSGEEALKQLDAHDDFAVVLLDVSMPGIDGFQTARLMRQREQWRHIPIIFLTGVAIDPASSLKGYAQGAVDYLLKPYNLDVLRAKVGVFVELHHAREELRRLSVAEARHAEAEAERRRLQQMLYDAPVALGELRGPELRFVFVNPAFERMVNRKGLLGKTVAEAFPLVTSGALLPLLQDIYRDGRPFAVNEFATPFDRDNKGSIEEAFFSFSIEPLRDERGKVMGMMGVAVEVTEQVLARRRVEEALRARDDFIQVASHELRTPMTTLRLQTDALLHALRAGRPMSPDLMLSKLQLAMRQLDRLDKLVSDLVDVTRISSGRLELHRDKIDLGALAEEVLGRFSDELARAGCVLALQTQPGLVGNWDRFRVDQVLTNLVTNAMKYGAGKPIEVRVERKRDLAVLSVRDEGVGIPPEEQKRIFERFERASTGKKLQSGLGLGLWIAQKIVVALGGTLDVASVPGQGSCFTVRLPLD